MVGLSLKEPREKKELFFRRREYLSFETFLEFKHLPIPDLFACSFKGVFMSKSSFRKSFEGNRSDIGYDMDPNFRS